MTSYQPTPPVVSTAVRSAVQYLWTMLLGYPAVAALLPNSLPEPVVYAATAGVMLALVWVIRKLETANPLTPGGRAARWLARIIMLGINRQPAATTSVTRSASAPTHPDIIT
jgi:hypothetical protein